MKNKYTALKEGKEKKGGVNKTMPKHGPPPAPRPQKPIENVEQNKINIEIIQGVEGKSLYLNDIRVAGNKPWGGGSVVNNWKINEEDLIKAIISVKGERDRNSKIYYVLRELDRRFDKDEVEFKIYDETKKKFHIDEDRMRLLWNLWENFRNG